MSAFYIYVFGFITALAFVVITFAIVYFRLKQTRKKQTDIKGYLDLISDLTQKQQDQVQQIRLVFLPRVEEIRQSLYLKRVKLAELLFAEPVNRSMIYVVAEQIIQHQSELENEVIEHILEEKELLSPSQKRKFYKIILNQFSSGGLGIHDVKGRKM